MNQMSLNSAILQFAFSGVFAPHKREYASDPREVSTPRSATPPSSKKK